MLFLDMDSTLRHGYDELGRFVNGPDDVVVFPEARRQMEKWKNKGGRIITVSNQKGIGLGIVDKTDIGLAMVETNKQCGYSIDVLEWCPHTAPCWCRKPGIGMLVKGVAELGYRHGRREEYPHNLMLMVGDRPEDQECAWAAGINFQWAAEWRANA